MEEVKDFSFTMPESEFQDMVIHKLITLEANIEALKDTLLSEISRDPNVNKSGITAIMDEKVHTYALSIAHLLKQKYG
ncbi:hypothetical protein [Flavobacterium sp.]|uniref:hypothetical protein n=1 Tax=Flavobacterium sp. TaxID=239 RepID=UPI00374D5FBD